MSKYCGHCGKEVLKDARFCINCGCELPGSENQTGRGNDSNKQGSVSIRHLNKKEKIIQNQKDKKRKRIFLISSLAGAIALVIIIIVFITERENPVIKLQPKVVDNISYDGGSVYQMYNIFAKLENGKIIIPLDEVMKKKLVAFSYTGSNGIAVPMLAYLSPEGKVVTAISLCEPCNSTTFHIKGEKLICNACGTTWKLNNLEVVEGACGKYPPDPLTSSIVGNKVLIDESLAANWKRRI